jgi:hypothetical protein
LSPLCEHGLIFDSEPSPHFLGQWFEFGMYAAVDPYVSFAAEQPFYAGF